jgi:hypothetical protein
MNKNWTSLLIALLLSTVLWGCAGTEIYRNAPFDKSVREIVMAPGASDGLGLRLKRLFAERGYRIVADPGDQIQEQALPGRQVIRDEHKARYKMHLSATRTDYCVTGSPMYVFEMSIVDTSNGQEVLVMSGRDCGHSIEDKLTKSLGI